MENEEIIMEIDRIRSKISNKIQELKDAKSTNSENEQFDAGFNLCATNSINFLSSINLDLEILTLDILLK